jgi:hypothetical protein
MHGPNSHNGRRAQARNGNALTCKQCGRSIQPKRASHRQRYCSPACKKAVQRFKIAARYPTIARVRSPRISLDNSNGCKGHFPGRGLRGGGPVTESVAKQILEHPLCREVDPGLFPGIAQSWTLSDEHNEESDDT